MLTDVLSDDELEMISSIEYRIEKLEKKILKRTESLQNNKKKIRNSKHNSKNISNVIFSTNISTTKDS